ncbi:C40 family peptidase [Arcobacter sp. FWKO B]|uniref:C40 family peptidase n=1 Tax=Arcobacter sp. FWKO B TaxID=2593672 RepID=UPI001907112F|nr:C40 family peptidase [Arcobacter sp. FWKO B]
MKRVISACLLFLTTTLISDPLNSAEPSVFTETHDTKQAPLEVKNNQNFVEDVKTFLDTEYKKLQDKILEFAFSFLGQGYKFGASAKSAKTDCSLYTKNVFAKLGIDLPRTSFEQSNLGKLVSKDELQVGDLLFFRTYKRTPSHVGIYIGDNQMIHASFNSNEVKIDSLDKKYYKDRFLFAKRVI